MNYYSFFYFYSSSSLFTVNSSHAFVHVQPCLRAFDPVSVLLNTLAKPAINTKWGKELHKTSIMLMFIIIIVIIIYFINLLSFFFLHVLKGYKPLVYFTVPKS